MGVSVGGFHLEHAVSQLQDRDVKGPASQIVDSNLFILSLFAQPVCQRRGGGLVHDPLDIQACDPAGILRGLALRVVEISGDRDDRFGDLFAEIILGSAAHLLKYGCRNLGWGIFLAADFHHHTAGRIHDLVGNHGYLLRDLVETASHESLDGIDGIFRVGNHLVFRGLAYQAFSFLRKTYYRRCNPLAFRILDDDGLPPLHDCDTGIRCS